MQAAEAGARVEEALGELWVLDDVGKAVKGLLEEAFPRTVGAVYRVEDTGEISNDWRGVDAELFEVGRRLVPKHRFWDPKQRGPLDNRVVGTNALRDSIPDDRWNALVDGYLPYIGGPYRQLRFTVFARGRIRAWVGVIAGRERDFSSEEQVRLAAMHRPILDQLLALEAAGFRRGSVDDAVRSLDLFANPALLLSEQGKVMFANDRARAWMADTPYARHQLDAGRFSDAFACHRLCTTDRSYRLAVMRDHDGPEPPSLPPRLACVLELVLAGRSDKQIAAELGVTHSSARTYVRRLYHRLGVHGRAELWHMRARKPHSSR